jgi:hypothetical protein
MEKRKLVHVVAVAVCFLFALCSMAWAGIEPSPWKPEINKLNALENNLRSIHERVTRVLGAPPDPWTPSPNVNGVVGRLSAMENQLSLVNGMLVSVMDEVLGMPPDPWVPADMVPALEGVRAASQGIADSINAYLVVPPDPWVPAAFISALTNVGIASQNIADDAVQYMSGGGCTSGEWCGCLGTAKSCDAFTDPTSCRAQVGCTWSDVLPGSCIGTPTPCSGLDSSTCGSHLGCRNGECLGGTCQ